MDFKTHKTSWVAGNTDQAPAFVEDETARIRAPQLAGERLFDRAHQYKKLIRMIRKLNKSEFQVEVSSFLVLCLNDNGDRSEC